MLNLQPMCSDAQDAIHPEADLPHHARACSHSPGEDAPALAQLVDSEREAGGVSEVIRLHRFFCEQSPKYAGNQPLIPTLRAYLRFMYYSLRSA